MPNKPNKHRLPVGTLALVVLLLILSACQPTPEKEPVVVKTEDYVAEAIQPKDGTHDKYDAPNNVEFHNEISGLDLTINAPVVIPQTDVYPVAEIEKAAFDETYYRNVMRFFYPDEQWVETPQETKRDILERMSYLTSLAEESDTDVANELIELQQRLATAPDDSAAIPFSFNDLPGKTFFEAYHYNENTATYAVLVAQMNGNTYQYRRDSDSYWVRESNAETLEQKNDFTSTNPKLESESAMGIAQDAMKNLGADLNMKFSFMEKAIAYNDKGLQGIGWIIFFIRDCGGLQATYMDEWRIWKGSPPPSNAAPWESEYMYIIVDENGKIAQYDVRGAGEQVAIIAENTQLMPFDDILDRIKQQLVYNHAYQENHVEEYSAVVNEIRLASALINVKDRRDIGHLVPTWEVMYEFHERLKGENEPTVYRCRVCLNAIDGSYIEPKAYIGRIAQ